MMAAVGRLRMRSCPRSIAPVLLGFGLLTGGLSVGGCHNDNAGGAPDGGGGGGHVPGDGSTPQPDDAGCVTSKLSFVSTQQENLAPATKTTLKVRLSTCA